MSTPTKGPDQPGREKERMSEEPSGKSQGWSRAGAAGRRRVIQILVVVVVGTLVVWGARRLAWARSHESTDDAFVSGDLVPVLAKVGGYVSRVEVRDDEHVDEGQLLLVLEDDELRHRVDQANAELAAARAAAGDENGPGRVEAQVEQARRSLAAVAADLEAARARGEAADRDLERMERLAEKEIVSQQRLDQARAEAIAARSRIQAVEAQRAAAQAAVTSAQAAAREAVARLEAAQAAAAEAALELSRARIKAPVSGKVARKAAEPGQLLQPGQPVMTVVSDSGIHLTANFKETQIDAVRPGSPAEFDVDAYDGCHARGEVRSVGGATGSQFALLPPDNATGNFTKVVQRIPVRIDITEGCGEERPLRPGMSVVVHVATGGEGA